MVGGVCQQLGILLRRPWPLLHVRLVAARWPPHAGPFLRPIELENLHQPPVPPGEITAGWYRHTYSGGSGERGTVTTCRDGGEARDGSMSSPLLI
jgi:hypothetical protein